MKRHLRKLAPVLVGLFVVAAGAPWVNAQITNEIRAHLDHTFVIGNTTLPPGDYTFRMVQDSDLSVMTATSANDKTGVEFLVRETMAGQAPQSQGHSTADPGCRTTYPGLGMTWTGPDTSKRRPPPK
jgi:hypothetical protein